MRRRPPPPLPALGLWISNAFRKLPGSIDRPDLQLCPPPILHSI
jgi:hypothetical protein